MLKENVTHQAKEEHELLSKAKKELSKEKLTELGDEFQNFKTKDTE